MRSFLLLAVLVVFVGGCKSAGTVSYTYQNGRWTPTTAVFSRDDLTASEVRRLENLLNGGN